MKEIQLTQGKVTQVSDHRYEYLSQWKWHTHKTRTNNYYAQRSDGKKPFQKVVSMHTQIMGFPEGMDVDHKDRDGLNNQDENLRVCTRSQNQANKTKLRNNTSGFKGVTFHIGRKKWYSSICFQGRAFHLGSFDTPEAAAHAYDEAARKYYGEFAFQNFN